MRKKQRKSTPKVFICSIIAGVFILTGCYLKQKPPGSLTADQNVKGPQKVLRNHWDQFFSDIKKVDSRGKAHFDMAVYFQKNKKHHLALQEFQKAVQFDPTDAKTYNAMGISYDKSGDYEKAIQCYEMAIKLNPEMASAYNNLGYSKMLSGDSEGAIVAYQRAIELDDTNPRYRNNLGSLYAKSGRVEQAREQFEAKDDPLAADRKLDRLLGRSADNEIPQKRTVLSDILAAEPDNGAIIELQNDSTRHPELLKTLEVDANTDGNLGADDPDRQDIGNSDEGVVVIVYNNEHVPSVGIGRENIQSLPVEGESRGKRNINDNDAEDGQAESLSEKQGVEDRVDPVLLAANITTETQVVPLYGYDRIDKSDNVDDTRILSDKALAQPGVVEVVFRQEPGHTVKPHEKDISPINPHSVKAQKVEKALKDHISYDSVKIIEVGSARETNSQLLLAGLKLVDKPDQDAKTDIEVSNGNGVRGAARRLATSLNEKGFIVSKVSNANSFDHLSTKVLFRTENLDYVFPLLNELPLLIEDSDLIENDKMKSSIRIIIGKDLADG